MGIDIKEYLRWKQDYIANGGIDPCLYKFLKHKNRVYAAKIMHEQKQERIEQQIMVMQT